MKQSRSFACLLCTLLLLLLLQEINGEGGDITCHCTTGGDCNRTTNTCSTFRPGQCQTRVHTDAGRVVHVEQFCSVEFLSCINGTIDNSSRVSCCMRKDFCNGCPHLDHLKVTREELLAVGFQFSPGCVYDTATMGNIAANVSTSISGATPPSTTAVPQRVPSPTPLWLVPIVVLAVILLLLILLGVFVCYYFTTRRCRGVDIESVGNCSSLSLSYGLGPSMSGSSGANDMGNMILETRTVSHDMKLLSKIAKGGFGYVWKAEWEGKDYAVKIFPSTLYKNWLREGEIYKTCMLSHENILRFNFMEKEISTYGIRYWLVFDFHSKGSLLFYLQNNTLTKSKALTFLHSVACGLCYLHYPILTSTDQKPVIAHRDLKPSNILIKNNMTCCIGDLGLAVRESDFEKGKEVPDPFVGTRRYLAPEILGGTIRKRNIESYVQADMYSLSLIMWEVFRRCQWHGGTPSYEVPYNGLVPSDPTLEDMKRVVVTRKMRPPLDPGWKNDEVLSEVLTLTRECWRDLPESRLGAMRVKMNLQQIAQETKKDDFKTNETEES